MGHPSKNIIKHMFENTKGFDPKISILKDISICTGCAQGKMQNKSFPISLKRANKPLDLIHADLLKLPIESYHKYKWCLTILDDYSSYAYLAFLRSKSETFQATKSFIDLMENQFGVRIKRLRSDQGGEFLSHEFDNYLSQKGIIREKSAPHVHQQNGCAEALNKTILMKAESM